MLKKAFWQINSKKSDVVDMGIGGMVAHEYNSIRR